MVRLKGKERATNSFSAMAISIPYGAIKSLSSFPFHIKNSEFQFLMVRLKVALVTAATMALKFQFLMVRLKGISEI